VLARRRGCARAAGPDRERLEDGPRQRLDAAFIVEPHAMDVRQLGLRTGAAAAHGDVNQEHRSKRLVRSPLERQLQLAIVNAILPLLVALIHVLGLHEHEVVDALDELDNPCLPVLAAPQVLRILPDGDAAKLERAPQLEHDVSILRRIAEEHQRTGARP
jgi:hypothetical protein